MRLGVTCYLIYHLLAFVTATDTEVANKAAPAAAAAKNDQQDGSWMGEVAEALHPQMEAYFEEHLKSVLEEKIGSTLNTVVKSVVGTSFHFSSFNVSQLHLKWNEMRVLKLNMTSDKNTKTSPVKMDVALTIKGPVDVGMTIGIATITLIEVTVKVKARVTAAGPIPRPPFVSGLQLALLEKPWIDFKFSGATKYRAKQLLTILDDLMENHMGYPNILAMQLDSEADMRIVKSMNPTGVLAFNIQRAKQLLDEEGWWKRLFKMAKPDTYVRSQLGNVKHETKAILHNANPVYGDKWSELPLDTPEGYALEFSIYERSPTADVLYGTARVDDVKSVILNKPKELALDITLSDEFKTEAGNSTSGGKLIVHMKWMHLAGGHGQVASISNVDNTISNVNNGEDSEVETVKTDDKKESPATTTTTTEKTSTGSNSSADAEANVTKNSNHTSGPFLHKNQTVEAEAVKEEEGSAAAGPSLAYPGQSEMVLSLYLENLTVVEMLTKPKEVEEGDEKKHAHAKLQVGSDKDETEEGSGGLMPLGGQPAVLTLDDEDLLAGGKAMAVNAHADINQEYLFMVPPTQLTTNGVAFKFTCDSLDSPVTGTLKMDSSQMMNPSMKLVLENEGKTVKINLNMYVTIKYLKA